MNRKPLQIVGSMFSRFPDTPWWKDGIGLGKYGKLNAIIQKESKIFELSVTDYILSQYKQDEINNTINVYKCLRPLNLEHRITWNKYDVENEGLWAVGGGIGKNDSELLIPIEVTKNSIKFECDTNFIIIEPKNIDGMFNIDGYNVE